MIEISKTPIFTREVYSFLLPNCEQIKKDIQQIILVEENYNIHSINTKPEEECNIRAKRTAWNSHQKYPILQMLSDNIKEYILSFIKQEDYDIPKISTQNCWINWYGKNQNALPHSHANHLSAVLFVDVEKSDAKFFAHSNDNFVMYKKTDLYENFSNVKEIIPKDGTVLFFDGNMMHSVSPNQSDNKRITVAINYEVGYPTQRNEY